MSEKIKKETPVKKTVKKPAAKPKTAASFEKQAAPDATKTPAPPLVTSNSEKGGISGGLFALLLLAIVLGGGFATQSLWSPYVVDYLPGLAQSPELATPEVTLSDRLAALENEVSKVRQGGEAIADLERQRGDMNQSFEGVMARILELETQIDYVRGMLQATSPPSDAVQTNESLLRLSTRMNKLEASDETVNAVMGRLAKLEQAMADSGSNANSSAEQLSQTMAGISQRVGSLETGAAKLSIGEERAQMQVQAQTLVLAVGHLRETLRADAPFTAALGALEALGHGDPDIMRGVSELSVYAKTGIATMDTLSREYVAVARNIAAATQQGHGEAISEGVVDSILSSIKSLVSVRKSDSPDQGLAGSPATKARSLLGDGDLGGAVAVLSELSGPEASAAAPWLAKARARLMAETTLSRLHVFVVSLLAPVSN